MSTTTATSTTTANGPSKENDPNYIPRGTVTAPLNFFQDPTDGSKPYIWGETPPNDQARTNYDTPTNQVPISDIRGQESNYTLDRDAFQALQNIPSAADPSFTDEENIKSTYYPEVEQLILTHIPGAKRVIIFDHTIRRSHPDAHRQPVALVHIDQTPASAAVRVRQNVAPEEVDQLLAGRYRIINVWKPINGPVQASPLGVASSVSVPEEDLVDVELRYGHRIGETSGVRYSEKQRWFYWSGMTNEERLLLKCSDSGDGEEVEGRRAPHSAFEDSRTPVGARGRESIEVRTLVFG